MRERLSPRAYQRLTLLATVAVGGIIITGGAVRLTGSGLGCPDWPTCARGHLVAEAGFHPLIEFLNRSVTGLVSVMVVVAVLGSLVRTPRRRDLTWLSLGLVAGVIGQIVLGGLTVLAKLAPPFVMGHFLLSMALLADAIVLHHRAGLPDDPTAPTGGDGVAAPAGDADLRRLGWLMLVLTGAVLLAGTVVTSSGPHGGDANVPRWDFDLHRVTQVHGALAMLLVALVLATLAAARRSQAGPEVGRRAAAVLESLGFQVAVGYTQYFTGVPALIVGVHIAGAVAVWTAVVRLNLTLGSPRPPTSAAAARTVALVDA